MDELAEVVKTTWNELEEVFRMASEEFSQYDPRLWCGVIAGITTFVVELILSTKGIFFRFDGHKRNMAKAIEEGHIATATLEKQYISTDYSDSKYGVDRYHGRYVYEVNGIKGKVHVSSSHSLPTTTTVYWKTDPRKAFSSSNNSCFLDKFEWIVYIIPMVVFYLVVRLMGYDGS